MIYEDDLKDECVCGDYRQDHKDGTEECLLNWDGHGLDSDVKCLKFQLSRRAVTWSDKFPEMNSLVGCRVGKFQYPQNQLFQSQKQADQ